LQEVNNTLPDLRLNWYDWWLSSSVQAVAMKNNLKPSHANWLEAFSFTIVGEMPDGIKPPPNVPSAIMDAKTTRSVYGDGSFGGVYRAPEGVMQEMFTASVQDILQLLAFD
jgi:creatinine amidohydrolase